MKNETVTISMEAEKLCAVKRYIVKKEADLEQELGEQLQSLYEKYVPANVREYIDESCVESLMALPCRKDRKKKVESSPRFWVMESYDRQRTMDSRLADLEEEQILKNMLDLRQRPGWRIRKATLPSRGPPFRPVWAFEGRGGTIYHSHLKNAVSRLCAKGGKRLPGRFWH